MAKTFYVNTNICYIEDEKGEIGFPKKKMYHRYEDSDANIRIWGLEEYTKNNPVYSGAVTELTESDGTPYANKAALDVILQDFYG